MLLTIDFIIWIRLVANEYIDIIGFDACLMQMTEVVYEIGVVLTNLPNYMVGSKELEWGD